MFSQDSKLLLTADGVGTASVWRLDQNKDPEFIAKIPNGFPVRFASLTSDDKSIRALANDGKIWEWQLDQLEGTVKPAPVQLGDLKGLIVAAFFSGDGRHLLIPSQLNSKGIAKVGRIIDLLNSSGDQANGDQGGALEAATQAAALSSDGKLAADAGDDGTVRKWHNPRYSRAIGVSHGSGFDVLRGHEGPVYAVSFSPAGEYIATGGEDRTARLWPVEQPFAINPGQRRDDWWSRNLEELIHLAAKTGGRNFTCKEWAEFFAGEEYRRTFPELPGPGNGGCSKQAKSN